MKTVKIKAWAVINKKGKIEGINENDTSCRLIYLKKPKAAFSGEILPITLSYQVKSKRK